MRSGIVDIFGSVPDRLDWRQPGAEHSVELVIPWQLPQLAVIQFLAGGRAIALDGPDAARPFGRFERRDFFLKCLQTGEVCRNFCGSRYEEALFRFESREDPVDLPGICARAPEYRARLARRIPLRVILLGRIP